MSLSDYKMYPKASLVQKLPEIGGILFGDMPESIEKTFSPGGDGSFTYRSEIGFKLLSTFPETESEAVGVWNVFRVRKEKKISAYFGKGVAPVLFPAGLTLRSAEKVPVKNASAVPISWDRIEGFYWVLTYDLVLNVLRLKQNLASLAATHLLGYESPFSQEEITPVLNTFLKKAEKQSFKGVVKGASLKVYVSGNHVIGMDYHLPVMEYGKPSELLKIPDRIQYSGSQSVSEVEDVPDFYFRVQEGLVVPFYMDGVAACREGVREGEIEEENDPNCFKIIGTIVIYIVLGENTLTDEKIRIPENPLSEKSALSLRIMQIFESNKVETTLHFVSKEEIDNSINELGANDYVLNILNSSFLIGMNYNALGETLDFGENANAKLTVYSEQLSERHPEGACFIDYEKYVNTYRPNPNNSQANYPEYKIKDDEIFFDSLAHTCVHEIYHAIIWRAVKYQFLNKPYPYKFGEVVTWNNFNKKWPGVFDIKTNKNRNTYMDSGGHNWFNMNDMKIRSKEYSLNSAGSHVHFAYISELARYNPDGSSNSFRLTPEIIIDLFFLNANIKITENLITGSGLSFDELPVEIISAIKNPENKKGLRQGSAGKLIDIFRNDKLHDDFVLPFLKRFKGIYSTLSKRLKD